jgi:hypothetical protein
VPFKGRAENVMWDVQDPTVFCIAETTALHTYLYLPVSIAGRQCGIQLQCARSGNMLLSTHPSLQACEPQLSRSHPPSYFPPTLHIWPGPGIHLDVNEYDHAGMQGLYIFVAGCLGT